MLVWSILSHLFLSWFLLFKIKNINVNCKDSRHVIHKVQKWFIQYCNCTYLLLVMKFNFQPNLDKFPCEQIYNWKQILMDALLWPHVWSHLFMFCWKSFFKVSIKKKNPTILILVCWSFLPTLFHGWISRLSFYFFKR